MSTPLFDEKSFSQSGKTSFPADPFRKQAVPIGRIRQTFASKTPAQIDAERKTVRRDKKSGITSPHAISTPQILCNFDTADEHDKAHVARQEWRDTERQIYQAQRAKQRETLLRLKAQTEDTQPSIWRRFTDGSGSGPSADPLASKKELYELAREMFPPRTTQTILVCDFYATKAISYESTVGEMELIWKSKPEDVLVRWIHAPIGKGLVHSSLEDMFLHDGERGRPFVNASPPGFPYLDLDQVTFLKSSDIEDRRIAFRCLSEDKALTRELDASIFEGDHNLTFKADLEWRAKFLKAGALNYWNTAAPDHVLQLLDGSTSKTESPGYSLESKPDSADTTSFHMLDFFKDAHLAVTPFRCFHRKDGCLLTMSTSQGVDYIDKTFQERLEEPPSLLRKDPEATVVGHVIERFKDSGTSEWSRPTVEWLLEYLVTEIGTTPHNIRGGRSGCSITDALLQIVQHLIKQKHAKSQVKKSEDLVRAYLLCIDEIAALQKLYTRKLDFFGGLEQDIIAHEEKDIAAGRPQYNPQGEQPLERVKWAKHLVQEDLTEIRRLNDEMQAALKTLFHMRFSDQLEITPLFEEGALYKPTIFIITCIPLAFVAFGNGYGPVALAVFISVFLYAFGHQLVRLARGNDTPSSGAYVV